MEGLILSGSLTDFIILKKIVILTFKIIYIYIHIYIYIYFFFVCVTVRNTFSIDMAEVYSHPGYF